jgi:hypothetical protein
VSALAALAKLSRPSRRGGYALGEALDKHCRLALSHEGYVALVLDVVPTGASFGHQLENLHYYPPRDLEIIGPKGKAEIAKRAVLVCRSNDPSLKEAFLRLAVALLSIGGDRLTEDVLRDRIDELVSLFRAMARPAEQTVQGLWAELAMIAWSADPVAACVAWHSQPRALHDFGGGADRLEVKSCSTGTREHSLRHEQLLELPEGRTLLASLIVRDAPEGASVEDLCAIVQARTGGDLELRRRVEAIVTRSLGRDWREAATRTFALEEARSSLKVYLAETVPTIAQPIHPAISNISFTVRLEGIEDTGIATARGIRPFFRALLPVDDAG